MTSTMALWFENMRMKKLLAIAASILFIQSFIQIAAAVTLGSGVNITDGTIIKLTGSNCNITVVGNHSVTKLEVRSNCLLINASLTAPIYVNLPYSYDSTTKIINITCTANTTPNLYINSNIPDGYSCTEASQCTNGYCVHSYCRSGSTYCGDSHCDSGETCTSCSGDCGACAVLPGGGAAGATAPAVPPSKTQVWTIITPGAAQVMKVEKPEIGLKTIEIEVENKATSVEIKVEKLESKPAEVVHEVSSTTAEVKTYRYFQITHKNIEQQLKKAFLDFYVEKTWIDEGNIDPNTVALNRYTTDWDKLPTQKVSEDDDYIYYKAETTGFSVFAISGEEKKAPAEEEEAPKECPACPSPTEWSECAAGRQARTNYRCSAGTNYECQAYTEDQACEVSKPPVKPPAVPTAPAVPTGWITAGAVIAAVLALLAILTWKKLIKLPF